MIKQLVEEDSRQGLEKQKAEEQKKQKALRKHISFHNYDPTNVVINSTKKEYFCFVNEEDRIQKLSTITELSDAGECYWNKKDNILHYVNIDIDTFVHEYVEYDLILS